MSSILHILKILNSDFKESWLNNYLNDEGYISKKNKKKINHKINQLLTETIDNFFKSLISGEYILDTGKIIEEIECLKTTSEILLNPITVDDFDTQKYLLDVLQGQYIDILKIFSNIYLNFIKLVKSQNENPNIDIVFEAIFNTNSFYEKVSDENIKGEIRFFKLIAFVYRVDHFFNDSTTTYKIINQLENILKEHQRSKFHIAIKEKLKFLKFKWEIRQKSYKKNNAKLSKAYLIDDELFISTDKINYTTSIEKLKKWEAYIGCYYELEDWKSAINNIIIDSKYKKYNSLTILELLFLLKYFKDVNKDYSNLQEVVNEFEVRYNKNSHSENRFLYNKTYLYALNNKFSALLEQRPNNSEEIKELKTYIEKVQKKCNIDNFFIDAKYINYRLSQINNRFANRKALDDLSKEKKELDDLSTVIKNYKEKLNWSKNNHNLLFQLPYDECLVKSNIVDLDIFYASSIVLPLPHEESQENYEIISSKFNEQKQLGYSVFALQKEFRKIENIETKQNDALKELKNNQVKLIETITIFTAVIAFIITSIPSFTFVKDISQAYLFTGIIGTSLLIMLSFMFLFTKGIGNFKKPWIILVASIILYSFITYSLKRSIDKVAINLKSDYSKAMDSFGINKIKIDSVKILSTDQNKLSKESIETDSVPQK